MWRIPLEGGPEELLPELSSARPFRYWAMSNFGIYYAESRPTPVLKYFRFRDRKTTTPLNLPSPPELPERGLSVSADGSLILYMRVDMPRNEILLAPWAP